MTNREVTLTKAKLAEQVERYDEMVTAMKELAEKSNEQELSEEERNLLSVAYKNVIGTRRASCRILNSIENKESKFEDKVEMIQNYKSRVQAEMKDICDEILSLLDKHLIPHSNSNDTKVFYHKMKGDYYRYLAEFSKQSQKEQVSESAREAYQEAVKIANTELEKTDPIRLGLALNFSVFYYEILNRPKEACTLARNAFEDAMSELDNVKDDKYKDATLIMQLLRDNLTLWADDTGAVEPEGEEAPAEPKPPEGESQD